jgi:hypothetical protein
MLRRGYPDTIDEEEQRRIEFETREQRDCSQWFEHRRGRLTASNFGKILKFRKEQTKINFAESLFDDDNDRAYLPDAVSYGIVHEKTAIKKFLSLERCKNITYFKRGLWVPTWTDCAWLGASVDGEIVEENRPGIRKSGCVEIKTVFDLVAGSIEEIAEKRKGRFYLTQLPGETFRLKRDSHHYCQIQGQMAICQVDFCDFVVYHPSSDDIFVERIKFDDDFWKNRLFLKLRSFYEKYVVPLRESHT